MPKPEVEALFEQLTRGGELSIGQAASDIINRSIDKVARFAEIFERSSRGPNFFISETDRKLLDEIEYAGDGLTWMFYSENSEGDNQFILRMNSEGQAQSVRLLPKTMIVGRNLNITPEGIFYLWSQMGDYTDVAIFPPTDRFQVREAVHVVPLDHNGYPRMVLPAQVTNILGILPQDPAAEMLDLAAIERAALEDRHRYI